MPYGKELLADSRIKALCLEALENVTKLDVALEEIYRKGFAGTPQLEEAPRIFVERLKEVREEFCAQLKDCQDDPARWQLRQLDIAADPTAMTSGVSWLAALAKGNSWEQNECCDLLDQRMAKGAASREENQELLELFTHTPMATIFAGGKIPRLPEEKTTQVAGILAMCSYVTIKREPEAGVLPEMSFDAVCIWSSAITEALCRIDGPNPQTVAMVSCVMATQYMHISQWEVLKAGLESLRSLSNSVMGKILDNIHLELLSQEEDQCLVEWIFLKDAPFNYYCWLELLWQQEKRHIHSPERNETEAEAEAETEEAYT